MKVSKSYSKVCEVCCWRKYSDSDGTEEESEEDDDDIDYDQIPSLKNLLLERTIQVICFIFFNELVFKGESLSDEVDREFETGKTCIMIITINIKKLMYILRRCGDKIVWVLLLSYSILWYCKIKYLAFYSLDLEEYYNSINNWVISPQSACKCRGRGIEA